jgi:hypothetical protein
MAVKSDLGEVNLIITSFWLNQRQKSNGIYNSQVSNILSHFDALMFNVKI